MVEREQARRTGLCVDVQQQPRLQVVPPAVAPAPQQVRPVAPAPTPTPSARQFQPMQVLPAQVAPKDDVRPPQSVTIPALIGQRYTDAAQRLQGIAKVERRQRASSRPFDIVIDQSPGASVVPWPATVVLTVSDGSLVVVPPLQKQSLAFAVEQLKRQGLSWSVVEQDSSAPVGTVIRQAPEPGREVPRGTSVGLTVAKRPSPSSSPASPPLTGPMSTMTNPPVAIPRVYVRDYVGAAAPVAASELSSAGLKPQVQSRPSVRPRGEVFDQKPRNVEAPRGTVVDLLASDGSLVVMPSLRGQRIDRARTLLNRLELRPTFEEQPASAPPGTVIDQGIAADTVVRRGSTVRVVVAAVPPAPIVVRDYVGWSANEARADLQRQKLQAATQVRASSEPRERVVDQMPRNVEVKAGATVTLVVSDGTLVRVPRVTRLPLARAEQALQESDLTVQRQRRESDAPAGTVLQQDPAPDTEVPRGSAVRVFVAAARPTPPTSPAPTSPPALSSPPVEPTPPSAPPPMAIAPEPPPALAPASEQPPMPTPAPVDTKPRTPAEPPPAPAGTEPPPAVAEPPPAESAAPMPTPVSPSTPSPPADLRPTPNGGLSPWWFAAAALPFAAAGGWFLRGRVRTPKVRKAAAGKPSVAAEWAGAAEPPRLGAHEDAGLHIHIEVSGPHAAARPDAHISKEKRDE